MRSIETHTRAVVTHMIKLVIGATGQCRRKKKKKGKQTKHTAARPKALPSPDPVDVYLIRAHQNHLVRMKPKKHEPHHYTDDSSNKGTENPCQKSKYSVPTESRDSKL